MSVMGRLVRGTRWALGLALVGSWGAALAQQPAACPQGKNTQVKDAQGNQVPDARCADVPAPSAAKRFPYPGEEQTPATSAPAEAAPNAPQPATQGAAGKRFPYPGDADKPATPQTPGAGSTPAPIGPPLQDAGSSGTSTSSSSSSSSTSGGGAADDPDATAADANDPAAVPRSKRRKVPPVPRQSPSEREQEDVQVAGFYQNDGNFRGAYARAKDAVALDADDPAAHLALAEAARKLGKLDEAEIAYKRCLELDPVPKQRKVAERALKEMTGGGS